MFRIYFVAHFYFSERTFETLEAAAAFARSTTFDCAIYRGETIVAGYDFFGGLRMIGSAS